MRSPAALRVRSSAMGYKWCSCGRRLRVPEGALDGHYVASGSDETQGVEVPEVGQRHAGDTRCPTNLAALGLTVLCCGGCPGVASTASGTGRCLDGTRRCRRKTGPGRRREEYRPLAAALRCAHLDGSSWCSLHLTGHRREGPSQEVNVPDLECRVARGRRPRLGLRHRSGSHREGQAEGQHRERAPGLPRCRPRHRRALKWWTTGSTTHARLYLPDAIIAFEADGVKAALGWHEGRWVPNALAVVPVGELRNASRLLGPGVSELEVLKPLVDALNKISDDLVSSGIYARPGRRATGVEVASDEDGTPVNPTRSRPHDDLRGRRVPVRLAARSRPRVLRGRREGDPRPDYGQRRAAREVSRRAHRPGPRSRRAARRRASLSARAEGKQALFGRPVEAIGRLMEGTAPRPTRTATRCRCAGLTRPPAASRRRPTRP